NRSHLASHHGHPHVVETIDLEGADRAHLNCSSLIEREGLVKGQALGRYRNAGRGLIQLDHLVALDDAVELAASGVERRHQGPGEVFVRIAEMSELPVENGGYLPRMLQEVSDPVISMHDCPSWWHRTIFLKPAAAPIKQRIISRRRPREGGAPGCDGGNL